jgi:hypothetical protein
VEGAAALVELPGWANTDDELSNRTVAVARETIRNRRLRAIKQYL